MTGEGGPHLSLAETSASAAQRRTALIACAAYVLLVIGLLPFARNPLPAIPQIAGIYGTAVFIADVCTLVLLSAQFRASKAPWLCVLACAYLYSGLMALLHIATFPGALAPNVPLIGSAQTVGWLYVCWSLGFVALLFAAIVVRRAVAGPVTSASVNRTLFVAMTSVIALAAILLLIGTAEIQALPAFLSGDRFSAVSVAANAMRSLLALAALAVLWAKGRDRSIIDLWLSLTLVAAAAGPVLTDLAGVRYSLGWYAGRASFAFASCVLLLALLAEFTRLQQALSTTIGRLESQARSLHAEIERRELAEHNLVRAQRMKAIGQLAGGIAHDFNNLLSVISNNLQLIRIRHPAIGGEEQAQSIGRAVATGVRLTRQLLTFSGTRALRPELVSLQQWLPEIAGMVRTSLGDIVELNVKVDPDIGEIVVDTAELELALINLAVNARYAMPDGGSLGIVVVNELLPAPGAAPVVAIRMTDTGSGIAPENLSKVCEPFFTTKPPGTGSGLGLSQVFGFCSQAGGSVQVESEIGRGTTVTMRFPAASAAVEVSAVAPIGPGAVASILLVEDNEELAAAQASLLQSAGFDVECADNADSALTMLAVADAAYDVVISDITMPGTMNGVQLACTLRETRPDLPVILMTGYAHMVNEVQATGCVVLSKPVEFATLLDELTRALRKPGAIPLGKIA